MPHYRMHQRCNTNPVNENSFTRQISSAVVAILPWEMMGEQLLRPRPPSRVLLLLFLLPPAFGSFSFLLVIFSPLLSVLFSPSRLPLLREARAM